MNIEELAQQWQEYKAIEQEAIEHRRAIEQQIQELMDVKEEGTTSYKGERFNVKAVGKLNRSLNAELLQEDWNNLPKQVTDCVKWKPTLDTKALRDLEAIDHTTLSRYMTTKPSKPSFKIEPTGE